MSKSAKIFFLSCALVISMFVTVYTVIIISGYKEENSKTEDVKIVNSIKPEEAKKNLENDNNIVLLDVRTKEEYIDVHIPGSILIPNDVIKKEVEMKIKDKENTIYVYCRSGNRSRTAVTELVKMGYTNVYDLGGIQEWPYETESGER
ncbi:MAG TPA: rhodanese-like domain-containing protein [Clostridiales bacterium]|nr:rhodanese-like domain-containing protein [Clostridiales bacterium]